VVYSDPHLDVIQSPLNMAYVFTSPNFGRFR
jgi:hypothetical protein